MGERVWTEAKLKGEEMLRAVDAALAIAGDRVAKDEREAIMQTALEVREAIASRETTRLTEANQKLDDATQTLAAIVVEKVMAQPRSS
jgi:molecular chaperone DnaK